MIIYTAQVCKSAYTHAMQGHVHKCTHTKNKWNLKVIQWICPYKYATTTYIFNKYLINNNIYK